MQSIKENLNLVERARRSKNLLALVFNACRLLAVFAFGAFSATSSMAQSKANLGVSGLPTGPNRLAYPLNSTPSNDAFVRNNAWAAYNANLHQIPTTTNPNRLAARQNLQDQNRFIQRPNSAHRYNFQFSDNESRSVQAALRRMGMYCV